MKYFYAQKGLPIVPWLTPEIEPFSATSGGRARRARRALVRATRRASRRARAVRAKYSLDLAGLTIPWFDMLDKYKI